MTDKALISDLTWRTIAMQRKAFADLPCFLIPDDLQSLLRPTTRKEIDRLHVLSLGIIADREKDFREFLAAVKKRKCEIVSREDNQTFVVNENCENIVKWWKDARRNGAAKIGARMSAEKKMQLSAEAADKIRDRWCLPSKDWPTQVLLGEAGISLNTAKKFLGRRPLEQANYQAKMKRKERHEQRI